METAVLVCGAGASGLTMAVELAQRGVAVMVIDKSAGPFVGSRGKGVQPRTLEILEDLGVVDRVASSGGYYPPVRFYDDGGAYDDRHVMSTAERTPTEPYVRPMMVPQWATEGVLRERLAELGHQVRFGCELVGLRQDEAGVTCHLRQEGRSSSIVVKYLIAADGGRSFIRRELDISFDGETLPIRTLIADVELSGLDRDVWHRWGDGDHQLMITPLRGTSLHQILAPVPEDFEGDLTPAGLTSLVAERAYQQDIVVRAVRWASTFGTNERVARRYRVGRIFLAGDSAHVHPPTGGLGLNTSIQDAHNLAWRLAARVAGAPDEVLDGYEMERRPVALSVIGTAGKLLEEQRRTVKSLSRGREVHQLDLTYREMSEGRDLGRSGRRVGAGDRAPDARCRGAAGQDLRLFSRYWGVHWSLLAYELDVPPDWAKPPSIRVLTVGRDREIQDLHGDVRDGYDLRPGEWALIRPDGYIAATGSADRFAELDGLLAQVGVVV